jgi:hypothetical protein
MLVTRTSTLRCVERALGQPRDLGRVGLLRGRRRQPTASSSRSAALPAAKLTGEGAALGHDLRLLRCAERAVRDRGAEPRAAPVHLDRALVVRRKRDLDALADELGQLDCDERKPAVVYAVAAHQPRPARGQQRTGRARARRAAAASDRR